MIRARAGLRHLLAEHTHGIEVGLRLELLAAYAEHEVVEQRTAQRLGIARLQRVHVDALGHGAEAIAQLRDRERHGVPQRFFAACASRILPMVVREVICSRLVLTWMIEATFEARQRSKAGANSAVFSTVSPWPPKARA